MLMSDFFKDHHDSWMREYFHKGGDHSIFSNGARQVWGKDKRDYLIECSLDVRVVPDLVNGIRMIGVVQENDIGLSPSINFSDSLDENSIQNLLMKRKIEKKNNLKNDPFLQNSSEDDFDNMDEDTHHITYQILFNRIDSKIIGVNEACYRHLGMKSSFFSRNRILHERNTIYLDEISPELSKKMRNLEMVDKYLSLSSD